MFPGSGYLIQSKLPNVNDDTIISSAEGYKLFSAGLSVGLACLASGYGMGSFLSKLNDESYYFVRKGKEEPKQQATSASKKFSFTTFVLCLIYLEAIGLYGLIIALFLVGK